MNKLQDIEIKITTDIINSLLEGKKIVFDHHGMSSVILHPPKRGVFLPYDSYRDILYILRAKGVDETAIEKIMTINNEPKSKIDKSDWV